MSVLPSSSMTSLVWEQAFVSLPSQQVSSSSTALSTLAEPSQPVITDSTWEEYQQAETHNNNNNTEQHFDPQHLSITAKHLEPASAAVWRAAASCLYRAFSEGILTLRTQIVSLTENILAQSSPDCLPCPSALYVALFRHRHMAVRESCEPSMLPVDDSLVKSARKGGRNSGWTLHQLDTVWHAMWRWGTRFVKRGIKQHT